MGKETGTTRVLRPYQKEDAKFLVTKPAMACFNEQRTGKTPTALATIKLRKLENEKVLIIATASSLYQWAAEYERWVGKPCVVCDGTLAKRKKIIKENWTHGLVISLDSCKTTIVSKGAIEEILKAKPKYMILDEAHRIKTPDSASAKSMFKLAKKIPNRLALTGTPAPGKAYDIYSILYFLGITDDTDWQFKHKYFDSEIHQIWDKIRKQPRTYTEFTDFKKGMQEELQSILADYSTQRKRKDVMPWLPSKDYVRVPLQLAPKQKRAVNQLHTEFRVGDLETKNVLEALIRERQLCLHPALVGVEGRSPKLDYIKQYISDYPDEPIIIFSTSTQFLKLLYNELKARTKLAMIIGATPKKTREVYKQDFQAGKFNIFLINIQAGKEALTLDRAETAIFTDKFPPIGDILQAEDRFIATTEDKASKPHKIIELMMTESYDEQIYTLLEQRFTETDVINDYNKYLKQKGVRYVTKSSI